MSFPYIDRPMWLYSRSSDKRMFVLIQQMRNLLEEANHRGYTVVGTSQDMGTGRSTARMGLKQMMQAVQGGFVRAVPCAGSHPSEPRSRHPDSNTGIFAGSRCGTDHHRKRPAV